MVPEGAPGKVKVPVDEADFTTNFVNWTAVAYDDSSWQAGNSGFGFDNPPNNIFGGYLGTNGAISMPNNSAFVRFKFNVADLTGISLIRIKAKYDDGYLCYLNGVKIDESFAPPTPTWNSAAVLARSDGSALSFPPTPKTISGKGPLVIGENVLAFHMLNSTTSDWGALMRPQFEVEVASGFTNGYLSTPTRGAVPNSAIKTAIGPVISDTTDKPNQPTGGVGSAPLLITTRVTQTLRPISAVFLKWRRMYTNEATIIMVDTGANGDVTAGDGIYTAQVPTTTLLPGEMIRWRIEARDNASPSNFYSYDPPYPSFSPTSPPSNPAPDTTTIPPVEADQYFGTVALAPATNNSLLPVLHWFVAPGSEGATEGSPGARCSFFFKPLPKDNPGPNYIPPKPRFYDHILVNVHGQSSGGFPKKSHDLSFGKDNKFEWKDGEPRSSGTNLLSNYADKTKVRNTLAWDAWRKSGHTASHYGQLVRVQRNAAFRGIYDLVENANAAWLDREGLSDGDALYKIYNRLDTANFTTTNDNGVEKKNPDNIDNSDLAALVAGISSSNTMINRLRFVYDNVDVESLINFLAVHSLILNRDMGHKNYYMYRDTAKTGEWHPLPWDQDLSLGHTWNSGPAYFDDDIHSQGPVQIGVSDNRLIQIVYGTPELNAMFVRRVRTLVDQFYVSAVTTDGPLAQKANATLNLIDPNPNNPALGTDDADEEMRRWGFWVDGSSGNIPYTDNRVLDHTVRAQGARLTTANPVPPYPGSPAPYAGWGDGSTSMLPFIPGRRDFFFKTPAPTSGSIPLPASQPANPPLFIEQINFNPGASQDGEYFVIRNPNTYSVDLSGWKLSGDISLTLRGGTVIPAQGAAVTSGSPAASYINQLVVANKPQFFRQRVTSPKANEFRLVAGPYDRQLSARGGSIILSKPNNPLDPAAGYTTVMTQTFTGAPTASQNFLRITELNYRPAPATAAELLVLPGLVPNDFEFIELTNTGPTALNLGKASFEEGIRFTFPDVYTLNPGERCLVVASQAAFEIRYGTGHPVLGGWEGVLDNSGERLRILDSIGEEVLDFTYSADWFPLPTDQYRSLVVRTAAPGYDVYSNGTTWALSATQNGSPNSADSSFSTVYEGWRLDHFTNAELPTSEAPNLPAAFTQDPDADGLNNFGEYCYGRLPKVADNSLPLTTAGQINVGGINYLTITFVRRKNALDLTYFVEASTNPGSGAPWSEVGVLVNSVDLGNGLEQVTFRDTAPITTNGRFLRVRAVK
jgi:hypothetical protein